MSESVEPLRVLVVDDHALFRRGLVRDLDEVPDLAVIAEAEDGEVAVEEAIALAPDVILMDVRMPRVDGVEATRRILEATPTARVLILTISDDVDDLLEAVKSGAAGYLLKDVSSEQIAQAARRVAQGHSFVSPELAGRLLEEFTAIARRREPHADHIEPAGVLTPREIYVLELVADGADNEAIAVATEMTEHAVRNHVRNILAKLQLATRTEAVLYAVRSRLIDP